MKILIDADEWYPVYYIGRSFGVEREVPDEVIANWKRVQAEFEKCQEEMEKFHGEPTPD